MNLPIPCRHRILSLLALLLLGLGTAPAFAQDQPDATEIVRKAYEKFNGQSSKASMEMQIIRPSWQRSISMQTWSLGTKYSMILITGPARDEGTAFLKRGNEIWNWVPRIGRTVKMPPSMMSQSWMGSDFTNNDLVEESSIVTDYDHTLMADSTINGYDCYKVRLDPKPGAPVIWDKVLMWISKDEYLQLRSEFYNEYGERVNVMIGKDVKKLGGRLVPATLEMIPQDEEGHKTVLHYNNINFDVGLDQGFFSVQNMKRLE